MVIDKSVCGSLTRIELLYLSDNGWYAKDIKLICDGVSYGVLGSTCTWFDLENVYGEESFHSYELVGRAELSRCLLIYTFTSRHTLACVSPWRALCPLTTALTRPLPILHLN